MKLKMNRKSDLCYGRKISPFDWLIPSVGLKKYSMNCKLIKNERRKEKMEKVRNEIENEQKK